MKKYTAILLLAAILSSFTACGDPKPAETTSPSSVVSETAVTEAAETRANHALPALDFGGTTYHTSYLDWQEYAEYFFADETTGDAMNDAIFERTLRVEDTLNVKMTQVSYLETNVTGQIKALKAAVQAGEDAYQMALLHCCTSIDSLVTEGFLYTIDNLPYVNLDAEWWNRDAMDNLRLGKWYYYGISDYNIPVPFAVYFNKDLITDNNMEDPYTLVREGKWTMDKMFSMGEQITQDIDGDGKYSDGDTVGMALHNGVLFVNFMQGAGEFSATKGSDGKLMVNPNVERVHAIAEKLYNYLNKPGTFVITSTGTNEQQFGMLSGKVLFRLNSIAMGHHYRDVEENIGIVPYPKFDENQKEYISMNWGGLMCFPSSIQNPEMVGAVQELLAWESANTVIPAYYDVMLDGKLARDEQSIEMLDLLFSSFAYDPGMNYALNGLGTLAWTMFNLVATQKSSDYASFYAKNEPAAQKALDMFYEKLDAYESQ